MFRTVAAAQVPDFPSALVASKTGEQGSTEAWVYRADFWSDLTELSGLRSNGQITKSDQYIAATNGISVDACDDGLGDIADDALQLFDR
ncbi:hypothetical protein D3C80_1979580 [compost metagenome]